MSNVREIDPIAMRDMPCWNARPMPQLQLPEGSCWGDGLIHAGERYREIDDKAGLPMHFCKECATPRDR